MYAALALAGPARSATEGAGVPQAGEHQPAPRRLEGVGPERVQVEGTPLTRVELSVSVVDAEGRPISGLQRSDFLVREAGLTQSLVDFGREADREDRPLSAAFLVDRSGSVREQMGKWVQACGALASALRPIDEVQVAVFTTERRVLVDFTRDLSALDRAVAAMGLAAGGTRVFAALDETLHELRRRRGRKVVFLLTDGLDNDYAGAWTTREDAFLTHIVQLAVGSQITVVTILPGPTGRGFLAAQALALETGGWWHYTSDDLPGLVRRLGERLLESYYLSYDSPRPLSDTRRRDVQVALVGPRARGAQVRTVAGVFGRTALLEVLIEELRDGEEDEERLRAARDLGYLRGPEALRPLRKALKDEAPGVRSAAAEALGRRGDLEAAEALARLLEDPDAGVRIAALAALQALLAAGADEELEARILAALEGG